MTTQQEYKDTYAARLDAKVAAVNMANAEAERLQPIFVEAFRPFIGKKILTHGGLAAKPKAIVDALVPFVADGYKTPSVYRHSSDYSLTFVVKTCVSTAGGNSCAYHETTFCVGELDGYMLRSVPETFRAQRSDWTAGEVRQLRKDLDEAEKAMRTAQGKLGPFSRYDN